MKLAYYLNNLQYNFLYKMKTIAKLNNYRNVAFIAFLKDTSSIVSKFNAKTLKLDGALAKLSKDIAAMDAIFGTAKGSANTESIESLDARRDTALAGISFVAEGYSKHFEAALNEAGKIIVSTIGNYGRRIHSLNYLAETEVIRSLVTDFETKPEVANAINQLNINNWVEELKTANNEFNTMYLIRNTELAEQPDLNIQNLRNPANQNFEALIALVTAYNTITPNADYKKILDEVEELIVKYNATIPTPKPRPKKTETPVSPETK